MSSTRKKWHPLCGGGKRNEIFHTNENLKKYGEMVKVRGSSKQKVSGSNPGSVFACFWGGFIFSSVLFFFLHEKSVPNWACFFFFSCLFIYFEVLYLYMCTSSLLTILLLVPIGSLLKLQSQNINKKKREIKLFRPWFFS